MFNLKWSLYFYYNKGIMNFFSLCMTSFDLGELVHILFDTFLHTVDLWCISEWTLFFLILRVLKFFSAQIALILLQLIHF